MFYFIAGPVLAFAKPDIVHHFIHFVARDSLGLAEQICFNRMNVEGTQDSAASLQAVDVRAHSV